MIFDNCKNGPPVDYHIVAFILFVGGWAVSLDIVSLSSPGPYPPPRSDNDIKSTLKSRHRATKTMTRIPSCGWITDGAMSPNALFGMAAAAVTTTTTTTTTTKFARVTLDQLHLRIGRIHPLTGFFNIPKIFTGSYRDPSDRLGVLDYLGREFHVQFLSDDDRDGPKSKSKSSYPFQHSGESVGDITSFRLKVADQPIRFVSFWDQKRKG
jgi:hypothetical protein